MWIGRKWEAAGLGGKRLCMARCETLKNGRESGIVVHNGAGNRWFWWETALYGWMRNLEKWEGKRNCLQEWAGNGLALLLALPCVAGCKALTNEKKSGMVAQDGAGNRLTWRFTLLCVAGCEALKTERKAEL